MLTKQEIKIGDCRELIKELPDNSIDTVITSPPYYGLRDYKTEPIIFDEISDCEHNWQPDIKISKTGGTNDGISLTQDTSIHINNTSNFCSLCGAWRGQLGLEPSPELYIKHLLDFFDSVKLKLKDTGSCFVNLGDTYNGTKVGNTNGIYGNDIVDKNFTYCNTNTFKKEKSSVIPVKSLCMIPSRFAWGMIERGWILRNENVWYKKNSMPESVIDRWKKSHEMIYFFIKKQRYYFDLDSIRKPYTGSTIQQFSQPNVMNQQGGIKQDELRGNPISGNASRCNKMVQSLAKKDILQQSKRYSGKFDDIDDAESFGSPRARTQRKSTNYEGKWEDNQEYMNNIQQRINEARANGIPHNEALNHPLGANPGDVWMINTKPYAEAHFAVFPIELVKDPILATCPTHICSKCGKPRIKIIKYESRYIKYSDCGCNASYVAGTVLDPFCGSGTVLEFCRLNGRNVIGFELNPDYKPLIVERGMIDRPQIKLISNNINEV